MNFKQACDDFLDGLGKENFLTSSSADIIIIVAPVLITGLTIVATLMNNPQPVCVVALILICLWVIYSTLSVKAKKYFSSKEQTLIQKYQEKSLYIESLEKEIKLFKNNRLGLGCLIGELIKEVDRCNQSNSAFQLRRFYNQVVAEVSNHLCGISNRNPNFSVAIYEISNKHVTMVAQRTFSSLEEPGIYEIKFPKKESKKYLFGRIACSKTQKIVVLENHEAILKTFYFKDDESPTKKRYSQYIGLPVCRKVGKNFALMEIVAFDDARINGETKQELKDFVESHVIPIIDLMKLARCLSV